MDDPFAEVRDESVSGVPLVSQKSSKKQATMASFIQLYKQFVSNQESLKNFTGVAKWVVLIADALMHEPDFQKLCLDNAIGSYAYKPPVVTLSRDWLAGLVLPGFYDGFGSFEEGWQDVVVTQMSRIVDLAEQSIRVLLQEAEHSGAAAEEQASPSPAAKPITELTVSMMTLFQLVSQEKTDVSSRNRMSQSIRNLGPLLTALPKASLWLKQQNNLTNVVEPSLLDEFGRSALECLDERNAKRQFSVQLKPVSILTDDERTLVADVKSSGYVLGQSAQTLAKKQKKSEGKQAAKTSISDNAIDSILEPSSLLSWLQDHFDDQPEPIRYPGWFPGTEAPFQVEHFELEALQDMPAIKSTLAAQAVRQEQRDSIGGELIVEAPLKKAWRVASSFMAARAQSDQEAKSDPAPEPQTLLATCLDEVDQSLDKFEDVKWRPLFQKFTDTTTRSYAALSATSQNDSIGTFERNYTETALYDNWFHVRKLIQVLRMAMSGDFSTTAALDFVAPTVDGSGVPIHTPLKKAEEQIMHILVAIQGGSDRPLAWLITLDHVLRNIWRVCSDWRANAKEDQAGNFTLVKLMFDELSGFAQGAGIYAAARRFKYEKLFGSANVAGARAQGGKATQRLEWYHLLFALDPRCANTDCNRLLPNPAKFSTLDKSKEAFSIGSRDTRGGKRVVREFISHNRASHYPCFIDVVYNRRPNLVLAMVLCYYSHLFHAGLNAGCKDARGKWAIPGMA